MMNEKELLSLIKRYTAGQSTDEEREFLESWFIHWNYDKPLNLSDQELEEQLDLISSKVFSTKQIKIRHIWRRVAAAAAILIFASLTLIFVRQKKQQYKLQARLDNIQPGSNKAILTLANGQQVTISASSMGKVAQQSSVSISQLQNGTIVYSYGKPGSESNINQFNTINTPAAGHYHLQLSDGTGVWLNAMSSIRFPVVFYGKERKVEITGEAYFEVAHNAKMPFKVVAGGNLIEDIGTHFNVNSYSDEPLIKTTLIEGSVKIYSGIKSAVLTPGEQSQLHRGIMGIVVVQNADVGEAIGWKDGVFRFHDTEISEVMRQLSRWYDIDIKYEGNVRNKKLTGEILRGSNINHVFDMLNFFKINCRIQETDNRKVIIVSNK